MESPKGFRPLRFVRGVANGIIGCDLTQVNVTVNGELNITHLINSVHPGPALEAGVRPMDILLEVDGRTVENQPVSVMKSLLEEACSMHGGEFSVTVGRIMDEEGTDPDGWGQYLDQHGKMYYFNAETGESSWTAPVADLPPGWTKVKDDTTGTFAYENSQTQERSLVRPAHSNAYEGMEQPVIHAGWINKRREDSAAWRLRWVSIMRNGFLYWSKSMAGSPLGGVSLNNCEFTASFSDETKLYTILLELEMPDHKGHTTIQLGTDTTAVQDKFLQALRFGVDAAGAVSNDLGDVYGEIQESTSPSAAAEDEGEEASFSSKISLQGWFVKQGSMLKTWRRRYFLLQNRSLRYFDSDSSAEKYLSTGKGAKNSVLIQSILPLQEPLGKQELSVSLMVKPGRAFQCRFEDQEKLDQFIAAVSNAVGSPVPDGVSLGEDTVQRARRLSIGQPGTLPAAGKPQRRLSSMASAAGPQ